MRKLYAAILSAAICLAVSGAPAWASEHQSTLSAGYLHADERSRQDDLNGINVKYRYEFTDTLGMVTSSAMQETRIASTRYSDTRWHEDSVVTAGSAYGGAVCARE
ncbi:enterobacterial Ail/Lom family protein [Escherichia coli P0304777.8]|nr:enterobacterial Ail/Lom family protein [Escherichia coli P0304777.8]